MASELQVTDEFKKSLEAALDPESIRAAVLAEAEKQGYKMTTDSFGRPVIDAEATEKAAADKAAADKAAADKAAADAAAKAAADAAAKAAAAAANKTVSRTENIGGKDITFSGASEAEVSQQILAAYRTAYALKEEPKTQTPTPEEIAAKKVEEDQRAAALAELDLKFKRGEISVKEYMEKSGAMDSALEDYLAKQGLSTEQIKEAVESRQVEDEVKTWNDAAARFIAETDWPGGAQNEKILQMYLSKLDIPEGADKVQVLKDAYVQLKPVLHAFSLNNLSAQEREVFLKEHPAYLTEHPEYQQQATQTPEQKAAADAAAKATADAAAKAAADAARAPRTSSSLFGASSGVAEHVGGDNTKNGQQNVVDFKALGLSDDATPQEIMAAWQAYAMRNGQNPDTLLIQGFSRK